MTNRCRGLCSRSMSLVVAALAFSFSGAHAAGTSSSSAVGTSLVETGAIDIDGNGTADALTDGVLLVRYLFGFRGPSLIRGAIGPGATRTTPEQIEAFLAMLGEVKFPVPPSGCNLLQSPDTTVAPVVAGSTVNLSLVCATGGAPASCAWSNGIASTACAVAVSPQVTSMFSATPANVGGAGPSVSATVDVATADGPAPQFCTGADTITNVAWPATGYVRPETQGFSTQRIAFKITVPMTFDPPLNISHLGFLRFAEMPGQPVVARDMTVSKSACDFQSGDYLFNQVGSGDTAPGANFTVNNPTGYFAVGANFNVQAGDVFYVNLRNANNGVASCIEATCNVLFDFATPNRY